MSDIERNAIVIGVTGGIACGKSEVGRILEGMGYCTCDADQVAHGLMAKGTEIFKDIVAFFGERILSDDGEICRSTLGSIVFENAEKREQLNALVHPAVRSEIERWISERRDRGDNGAVQIPLLFESGMNELDWDGIICVSASDELVLERLRSRGMDKDAAMKRIRSQMPLAEKERLSDCIIRNLGSLQELEGATRQAVESLSVER
ncbi:MAG TPA: dephospho-CoA kinase [Pontiella sp.]|nr:dephospho-CoA kinase [Pontiella sp.]